jgi:hypothetical protein
MRILAFALCLAAGCSMDLGHGKISPVVVERQVDLSRIPTVAVESAAQFSMTDSADLLSAADSAKYDQKYGSEVDAVEEVQLELTQAVIKDAFGRPITDASFTVTLADVPLVVGQPVELPGPITTQFKAAVRAHEALTLPLALELSLPADEAHQRLTARAVVQPIVTVNALDAIH